jgi:two-component system KDP operon response regulator KdpE
MTPERAGSGSEPGHRVDATPRVLVVEDDPFTARILRRVLLSRGVSQVVHATTIAEALGLLEPPPDWVILDLHLPDGSGLLVLQAIREAGLPTRVVVSSSSKDTQLIAALAAYKPDEIIPKPLNPALLPIGLGKGC